MGKTLHTRNLGEHETEAHLEMLNRCFGGWGDQRRWEQRYRQPGFDLNRNVFVIEEDGAWVGGITYWLRELIMGQRPTQVAVVGDVYTVPERRRKGVLSSLFGTIRERFGDRALRIAFVERYGPVSQLIKTKMVGYQLFPSNSRGNSIFSKTV